MLTNPFISRALAATLYVDDDGDDSGPNDCLDPLAPCATINYAIGLASVGDTINVAPDEYSEAGEDWVIVDVGDLTIQGVGGIGLSASAPFPTQGVGGIGLSASAPFPTPGVGGIGLSASAPFPTQGVGGIGLSASAPFPTPGVGGIGLSASAPFPTPGDLIGDGLKTDIGDILALSIVHGDDIGIQVTASGVTIDGMVVTLNGTGIKATGGASPDDLTVTGNAVVDNDDVGIDVDDVSGGALVANGNLVTDNGDYGIDASDVCGVASAVIDNNVVLSNSGTG